MATSAAPKLISRTANPAIPSDNFVKPTRLTHAEIDGNFKSLANAIAQIIQLNESGVTPHTHDYAPNTSPDFDGVPTAPTAAKDTNTDQIATTAFAQGVISGYSSIGVNTSRNTLLTDLQVSDVAITFTGALTTDVNIIFPKTFKRFWILSNRTTGGFKLTVKHQDGVGVEITANTRNIVFSSGSGIYEAINDFDSVALTGVPTAPTADVNTNNTQIATTEFVQKIATGYVSKTITDSILTLDEATGSRFYTLTNEEAASAFIRFGGTLTSDVIILLPSTFKRLWGVSNATTAASGAFTVTIKHTLTGTGTLINRLTRNLVYSDGTSVLEAFTDFYSVALTGTPTAPTAAAGTNDTQIATTEFVQTVVAGVIAGTESVPNASTTVAGKIMLALATDTSSTNKAITPAILSAALSTKSASSHTHSIANVTGLTDALAGKADSSHTHSTLAPLSSPNLTGTPKAPTAAAGTNNTQIATTAYVVDAISGYAIKSLSGHAANATITLTDAEVFNPFILLSGTITSNVTLVIPNLLNKIWMISNQTTGSFTITLRKALASGSLSTGSVTLETGERKTVYITDTDIGDVLAKYAPLASPTLTGTPRAPTATAGTDSTQIATTGFVNSVVKGYLNKTDLTGGTVILTADEAANAVLSFSGTLTGNLIVQLPSGSDRLWSVSNATTGGSSATVGGVTTVTPYTLTLRRGASGTTVRVAQGKRNLVFMSSSGMYDAFNDFESIALTGNSTAVTQDAGNNSTRIATTAFVAAGLATKAASTHTHTIANVTGLSDALTAKAALASPSFAGTPSAPTPASDSNSERLATTEFVKKIKVRNLSFSAYYNGSTPTNTWSGVSLNDTDQRVTWNDVSYLTPIDTASTILGVAGVNVSQQTAYSGGDNTQDGIMTCRVLIQCFNPAGNVIAERELSTHCQIYRRRGSSVSVPFSFNAPSNLSRVVIGVYCYVSLNYAHAVLANNLNITALLISN